MIQSNVDKNYISTSVGKPCMEPSNVKRTIVNKRGQNIQPAWTKHFANEQREIMKTGLQHNVM